MRGHFIPQRRSCLLLTVRLAAALELIPLSGHPGEIRLKGAGGASHVFLRRGGVRVLELAVRLKTPPARLHVK